MLGSNAPMDTPRSSRPTNGYGAPIARPCPRYGWRPRRGESHPRRLTSSAHPFRPWPALCLGCLLPWLPAWAPADPLTAAMTAVTARVLCLPSDGDPHTGSGFILGDGSPEPGAGSWPAVRSARGHPSLPAVPPPLGWGPGRRLSVGVTSAAPDPPTDRPQTALPGALGAAKIGTRSGLGRSPPLPYAWLTGRASAIRPIPRFAPRKDPANRRWRWSLA